ncbi:hypothetical protein LUZ63_018787 [Rhynchospora breviuscula]|uniref:Hexosyltransferase n=1 Tax=Rhynchospora breviuscula TaxID=2022672 RepID=A0A9Q0C529_9POAL|nr:hypothetical protein LUZ63_018787 [Rhynchospora breviuscula]
MLIFHYFLLSFPMQTHIANYSNTITNITHVPDTSRLRIFVGILTEPQLHQRRHLIRAAYTLQKRDLASVEVDVRFVFCNSITDHQKVFLSLEIMKYNDIILIDCSNNKDGGRTMTYFSNLPSMFGEHTQPFDYVVKVEHDAYFQLNNLAKFLTDKPRDDLYYGMEIKCTGEIAASCGVNNTFMAGFGVVVSWDLVEWIAKSGFVQDSEVGMEDVMLGKWLNMANKGKNRYNGLPNQFYDYKGDLPEDYYRHEFVPETVAVHKLEEDLHWARILSYFNVTHGLRPSKFYAQVLR